MLQCLAQPGGLSGQHVDDLDEVAVGRGLGQAGARLVRYVPSVGFPATEKTQISFHRLLIVALESSSLSWQRPGTVAYNSHL
jgi:hypothetical protein